MRITLIVLVIIGVVVAVIGMPARNQIEHQERCLSALNKHFAKLASTQGTAISACFRDRARGALGATTIEECITADRGRRVARARARTESAEGASCAVAIPAFGHTDAATVNAAAVEHAVELTHAVFGSDLDAAILSTATDQAAVKCQQVVAKAVNRCRDVGLKDAIRAKKTGLRDGTITDAASLWQAMANRLTADQGKSARCLAKLATKIYQRCVRQNVQLSKAFPGCGTDAASEFVVCLDTELACGMCLGLAAADDLDATACDPFDDGEANETCTAAEDAATTTTTTTDLNTTTTAGAAATSTTAVASTTSSTTSSTLGCGVCDFAHAYEQCINGVCTFQGCHPGYYDLNNDLADGCEYFCVFQGGTDEPDAAYEDANCDGIDGEIDNAVFVDELTGSDGAPGTMALPKETIGSGISSALSLGRDHVYVSKGVYGERVALANGISLWGGFDAALNWQRASSNTVQISTSSLSGSDVFGVQGSNITSPTTVGDLVVITGNNGAPGGDNYAFYCSTCSGLVLVGNTITAGAAGPGSAGASGSPGSPGGDGDEGGVGSCNDSPPGNGGLSGLSFCARWGGDGGQGGSQGENGGLSGNSGTGGTPGGSGGAGGDPGSAGQDGADAAARPDGSDGAGASAGGTVVGGLWQGHSGQDGAMGSHGFGGGGGGGGGGQGGPLIAEGSGNGGGGGGAGGCGGSGGLGGMAGGGSFGLFLTDSTGAQVTENTITSGTGGYGGTGGSGGLGGSGGSGGSGGTFCTDEIGPGGDGGDGSDGGRGGYGGGGAGGDSFAVYLHETTLTLGTNTLLAGSPGSGGSSPGSPGQTGLSGASN